MVCEGLRLGSSLDTVKTILDLNQNRTQVESGGQDSKTLNL